MCEHKLQDLSPRKRRVTRGTWWELLCYTRRLSLMCSTSAVANWMQIIKLQKLIYQKDFFAAPSTTMYRLIRREFWKGQLMPVRINARLDFREWTRIINLKVRKRVLQPPVGRDRCAPAKVHCMRACNEARVKRTPFFLTFIVVFMICLSQLLLHSGDWWKMGNVNICKFLKN